MTSDALAVIAVAADTETVTWRDEWTEVTEDFPLDQGRAALEAWLDAHGIPEADREGVFRIEIVKTSSGEVLRLLGRSDYEEEASSLS